MLSEVQEIINNRISIDGKNNFKFIYDQNTRDRILMLYYRNDNMKAMYAKYSEIVFIDGTYSINDHKYPLYLAVVKDCNGNSQIVAWALVAYERLQLLDMFFQEFFANQTNIKTKTVVTDKDLTEWNAITHYDSTHCPDACIFLCKFHCQQIFKRSIKNKLLLPILDKLFNCTTEAQMNEALEELNNATTNQDEQYLHDNWVKNEDTKKMWIKYLRKGTVTLDSDTNNNVETLNKQLKKFIKKTATMAQCITGIFALIDFLNKKYALNSYTQRNKVIIDRSKNADAFHSLSHQLLTPYAATIVKNNYEVSKNNHYKVTLQEDNKATLISSNGTYTVINYRSNTSCSCFEYTNTGWLL